MKKYLLLISTFISFHSNLIGAQLETSGIVFYSPTNAENPWVEDAAADTRYTFNTAVLNLLVYMDAEFNIKPITLKEFNWDYRKNQYILTIRDNLYFTNGRKVTIEDLEFSILRPFFANARNEGTMQLINIKGTEKINPGQAYKSGLVEGVKIIDAYSLSVTPSAPNPSFMYTLARSNYSLVPIEEFEQDLLNWKRWPIGVGPYIIKNEDKLNRQFTLELIDIENYPNAPKNIIFDLKRNLRPDLSLKDSFAVNNTVYLKKELIFPIYIRIISFNYNNELGSNSDFRKALNLALMRNPISKSTLIATKPLNEIVTKGSIGRLNNEEIHNINESKKIFQKILSKHKNKVFKIPYTPDLEYLGSTYRVIITNQLKEVGLNIEFIKSDIIWDTFQSEFAESPFRLMGKGADFYDPLLTFTFFKKGSPLINGYPNDDMLENLLEVAKLSSNRDILGKNIEKISKYFYDNNTAIALFEIPAIAYYNPKKIKSVGEQFGGQTFHLANIIMNNK
ncbi:ABC transporter substrate-binding protein [Fluviispira vulneris]|uniref:ABC transporter substrate-binding protein n=1 Tax=Fluviispira vulneris TaxID=2763012 RepID=UPI0016471894|nr:ABC transporter substrate-binding protein [Fluviispira vulneris]